MPRKRPARLRRLLLMLLVLELVLVLVLRVVVALESSPKRVSTPGVRGGRQAVPGSQEGLKGVQRTRRLLQMH